MKQFILKGLELYRDHGIPTGAFLFAVLTNDLVEAYRTADKQNAADMAEIVKYVYNEMPSGAWGSQRKVAAWLIRGGLKGKLLAPLEAV